MAHFNIPINFDKFDSKYIEKKTSNMRHEEKSTEVV